jgi:protein-L-isoaspartate(D-aspartate) O-methyltransferase
MARSHEDLVRRIEGLGLADQRIASAFAATRRELFVPADRVKEAYRDRPVVLPQGQTTSQPSLIAYMIDATAPGERDKVLEIGTGYGFQTALLAHLAAEVVSVERSPELAQAARRNLERNGTHGVRIYVGDGHEGWAESAPYDAIIVSAVALGVPDALRDQLREAGRLVIPVKGARSDDVVLYVKRDGVLRRERLVSPARFVPLVKDR